MLQFSLRQRLSVLVTSPAFPQVSMCRAMSHAERVPRQEAGPWQSPVGSLAALRWGVWLDKGLVISAFKLTPSSKPMAFMFQ